MIRRTLMFTSLRGPADQSRRTSRCPRHLVHRKPLAPTPVSRSTVSMTSDKPREGAGMPGAVVIGAGPGIGLSVGRRFAREGLPVALIARNRPSPDLADLTVAADCTDET